MRLQALLIPAMALIFGANDASDDVKQLQGSWNAISFESRTKLVSEEKVKRFKLVFKDDTFTLRTFRRPETGIFKLDPSKNPKTMDLIPKKGDGATRWIHGSKTIPIIG